MTSFDYLSEVADLVYRVVINNAVRTKPIGNAVKSLEDEHGVKVGFLITTDGTAEVSVSKGTNICHKRYPISRELADRIFWVINFVG